MTKEELGAVYRDYLAEEGFSPSMEEDANMKEKFMASRSTRATKGFSV